MDSRYVDDVIDEDEVPELTDEDFARMVPFSELPHQLQEKLSAINRGPNTFRGTDEKISVPISRSVAERFQVTGTDWESRVDQALREWLDQQKAS